MNRLIIGYALGVLSIAACASYIPEYFGLDPGTQIDPAARLLGPKKDGSEDLPLSYCMVRYIPDPGKPDAPVKAEYPCVVMKQEKFFEYRQEYQRVVDALKECQKGAR